MIPRLAMPTLMRHRRWRRTAVAFTLPELMVSGAILMLVIAGVISGHLFGLRMLRLVEIAAATNESDRRLLRLLNEDLAGAGFFEIGSASESAFTRLGLNRLQQANGLQIYLVPTNRGTTQHVRYFLSPKEDMLFRLASDDSKPVLLSTSIINTRIFSLEDSAGNTLSNRIQQPVLGVNIQFRDQVKRTWGLARDKETHWLRARFRPRVSD